VDDLLCPTVDLPLLLPLHGSPDSGLEALVVHCIIATSAIMAMTEMRRNDTSSQSAEVPETSTIWGDSDEDVQPKPSMIKHFVNKTGLDGPTLLMMFKSVLSSISSLCTVPAATISGLPILTGYLLTEAHYLL
jgi:hypothetical protein